ncbi:hypothetical protein PAXRUDRAFT_8247 [Paxillus rubicundulus Ve08.2h10]|uniref:Uncharacterized protein n=1 Tax=Paxillus rubicundulus Ve08.2h10 TaxID=930991 RepID=A0A0D0EAI9_9AGAM|nr:hypothetical protein PAXRUDRAFT_8247 [Paxillus rubicundulus Ve08.2h10]
MTYFRIPSIPRGTPLHRSSVHVSPTSPALSLPAFDTHECRPHRLDAESYLGQSAIRERKLNALKNVLSQDDSDSSFVWARYVDFASAVEYDDLPLEIHQKVLRKCVPHPSVLRPISARRMQGPAPPRPPHVYEARLKTVMRNIRSIAKKPSLEDYNYILEQFAAVGHLYGSVSVYDELKHVIKLQPNSRTVGLCLQSIAHRLTLPMYKSQRARIQLDCAASCKRLLNDMNSLNIPFTSVILDLVLRISKETADEAAFAQLLKSAYGIDLDYPDHLPIQWDQSIAVASAIPQLPTLHPFSTAALNTTIDMLGRFGKVSKLVQAFEVLTQPLPPQASQHYSLEFDDEDDFGVVNPASTQPHRTPHAKPNSTTYHLLLKHLSRADHSTLARHYLFQAFRLDRETDRAVRTQIYHAPYKTPAPNFGINRSMLLPVFGTASRNKDMQLMRFVGYIARQAYRRKKNDTAYYTELEYLQRQGLQSLAPDHDPSPPDPLLPHQSHCLTTVIDTPSSLSQDADVVNTTLTTPSEPSLSSPPTKSFDVSLHLDILRTDFEDIAAFYTHEVLPALTRKTQRLKERLGRRVWKQKNLYLRTQNTRSLVSREDWTELVNFDMEARTPKGVSEAMVRKKRRIGKADMRSRGQPGPLAGSRGLATSTAGNGRGLWCPH